MDRPLPSCTLIDDNTMPDTSTLTLDQLPLGQTASVVDVAGNDAIAVRLMEMGMTDGEPIEAIARAPLGDPLEFSLRGYRISLRKAEAARVTIRRTADHGAPTT